MTDQVKIMIVDDHQIFSESLASNLKSRNENFSIIYLASSGKDAIKFLDQTEPENYPDVILMDLLMEEDDGYNEPDGMRTSRQIFRDHYVRGVHEIKIIIISQSLNGLYISNAHDMAIHGYLPKECSTDEVIQAIHTVMNGEMYYRGQVNKEMSSFKQAEHLGKDDKEIPPPTATEKEIMELTAQGMTAKEIAAERNTSVDGVEAHKRAIMRKLGARNTAEMISIAYKKGYLKLY